MNKKIVSFLLTALLVSGLSISQAASAIENSRFVDVAENSPYYEAVQWAVAYPDASRPVSFGTDSAHFNPQDSCTRANVLTFLWRFSGSPESYVENPFEDVPDGAYYEEAARWAWENGIETGELSSDKVFFFPGRRCTRADTVLYLWLLAGRPVVKTNEVRMFNDVSADSLPERTAIAWALNHNIAKGTSKTTFSPTKVCTRGQVVTFLYRYHQMVEQSSE